MRSWTVEFGAPVGQSAASAFTFPTLLADGATLTRKRVADADIVDAPTQIDLARPVTPRLARLVIGVGLLAVVATALWLSAQRRRSRAHTDPAPRFAPPVHVTPLSAVAFLRRLEGQANTALGTGARAELASSIADIERKHFAPCSVWSDADAALLHEIVQGWSARAERAAGPAPAM